MDRASILGFVLIAIGVLGGQYLEGGHLSSLLQPAAFLIVIVGTAGAVALQSPISSLREALSMASWILFPPHINRTELLVELSNWSTLVRRESTLKLEDFIYSEKNTFAKVGLRLVVDNTSPVLLREALLANIDLIEDRRNAAIKVWESAGGYAPTIGILGAVLGLIHVMENLGDPTKLGAGIAVAFVATVYGVGLANLILLPIAQKLKTLVDYELKTYEMLTVGFTSIASNENPRLLTERCAEYLK